MSTDERKDLPPVKSANFMEKAREALQVYLGNRGDVLDRGVTLRDLFDAGMINLRGGLGTSGGTKSPIAGPGTGLEPAYEPDLTPPPTPSSFSATAAISNLLVTCDNPTYLTGHGHAKSKLYGATWASGALPVFANAVVITEFNGSVASYATNPATTWRLWLTWVSVDGVESTVPAGGTNGVAVTTGQDVTNLLTILAGEIGTSELSTTLNTRIDLIDASASVPGSVAYQMAAEALTRANAVTAEALTRSNADIAEANARAAAISIESIARTAQVQDVAYSALEATLAANGINATVAGDIALARLELNQNIIDGVAAEAALRLILAAKLDTDIGTTLAAVTSESVARAAADSSEASTRDTLAVQILGADKTGTTSGLVYTDRVARVAEDNALAQQITLLSAGAGEQFDWKSIWYFDSGVEGWTGNGTPTAIAGFLRPANQTSGAYVESPTGVDSDGNKYNQLRLRVRKVGSPTWAGYLWWRAVSDSTWDAGRRVAMTVPDWDVVTGIGLVTVNPAWTVTVDKIRVDLSSAQTGTDYFELDWVAVGRPSPGASSAQLLTEQTARAAADTAITGSVTTLSAQVNNGTTGLPAAHSLISAEQTARADAVSAEAVARGLLAARVTINEGNITTNAGAIVTEQGVRASADGVLTTNLNALTATVTGPSGVLDTQASLLANQSVQATATEAIARDNRALLVQSRDMDETTLRNMLTSEAVRSDFLGTVAIAREDLTSRIIVGELAEAEARLTLAAVVDTNAAILTSEQITRATQTSALSSSLTALTATVGGNTAAITAEQTARSDADSAEASTRTLLAARLDLADAVNSSAILEEHDARVTAISAEATARTTLAAQVASIDGTLATKASITQVATAKAEAISTSASVTDTISARLDSGDYAAVKVESAASASAVTGIKALYTIKLDVNNHVSGYGIYSDATGNSEFIANVNKFAVTTPTSSIPAWTATTAYTAGKVARIVTGVTDSYPSKTLVCLIDGTSAGTAPVLSGAIGTKVIDGTVTWQIASRVPFAVLSVPTTINGASIPAGVYVDAAYILKATIQGAQIADLAVDDTHIAELNVGKLTAGTLTSGEWMQSANYIAGVQGWRINSDTNGTAEFGNAVVRGTVYATDGEFTGTVKAGTTILGGSATAYASGFGFFGGAVASTYKWRVGDPSGARIQWDGEAVEIYNGSNALTMTSGGIDYSKITGTKPVADADKTSANTAAGILDQGDFATVSQLNSSNISTYIADAAIGSAQIGSIALVGTSNFSVKTAASGARMEMDSRAIKVFDSSGTLRVQIGDLTA